TSRDSRLPPYERPARLRSHAPRTREPQSRARLSHPRRHPDHAARRSARIDRRGASAARLRGATTDQLRGHRTSATEAMREVAPWPSEIRGDRAARSVQVLFESGERFELPAEYLRVESPSAEVQGHGAAKPPPVAGKANVGIRAAEPVGNYAVRFIF